MKQYKQWMESASEESVHQLLKSSMEITSSIRKDFDNKEDVDIEKMENLCHVWKTICKIKKANADEPEKTLQEEVQFPSQKEETPIQKEEYKNIDAKNKVEEMMKLMSSPTLSEPDPSDGPRKI